MCICECLMCLLFVSFSFLSSNFFFFYTFYAQFTRVLYKGKKNNTRRLHFHAVFSDFICCACMQLKMIIRSHIRNNLYDYIVGYCIEAESAKMDTILLWRKLLNKLRVIEIFDFKQFESVILRGFFWLITHIFSGEMEILKWSKNIKLLYIRYYTIQHA